MLPLRRGAALLASLVLSVSVFAGCNKSSDTTTSGGSAPIALNGTDAVATVDGQAITQSQFYTQLQAYQTNPQTPTNAGHAVLANLIQNLMIEGLAKSEGVAPTDAEVQSLYDSETALQDTQRVKAFADSLASIGLTEQDYKDQQIRPQLALYKVLQKAGNFTVSDADISGQYDLNKAKAPYSVPNRAHIKRIVLASQGDAKQIYDQIKGGKTFESFVSRSVNPQPVDGDLDQWVPLDGPQNPVIQPLLTAIKAANPGDTTPPFSFQGGWWLVKVVEKRPKAVLTLDQVKSYISFTLLQQKASQNPAAAQNFRQELRDYQTKIKDKISIPEKQYADLLTQIQNPPPLTPTPMAAPPGASGAPAPKFKIKP